MKVYNSVCSIAFDVEHNQFCGEDISETCITRAFFRAYSKLMDSGEMTNYLTGRLDDTLANESISSVSKFSTGHRIESPPVIANEWTKILPAVSQKKYRSSCALAFTVQHDVKDGSDLSVFDLHSALLARYIDVIHTDGLIEAAGSSLENTKEKIPRWQPDNVWGEHPVHLRSDWGQEAAANDTNLGYLDWVNSRLEEEAIDGD